MRRWVVTSIALAFVASGACGGHARSDRSLPETVPSAGAAGVDAGEPGCIETMGTCTCAWLTATCDEGKNLYVGQSCPPTLDEARLVANWPLGGPPLPGNLRRWGDYEECSDGTRSFTFGQCGLGEFAFDPHGQLIRWTENLQSCVSNGCDAASSFSSSCMVCEMRPDPPGPGLSCFSREPNDGPTTPCLVDEGGHWLMPPFCNN
jgi:hypothetical protein